MGEQRLDGGNMEPVFRVGDTVRRVTGPWTLAVHKLLDVYAEHDVIEAPRALGLDEQGREILSYREGVVMSQLPPASAGRSNFLRLPLRSCVTSMTPAVTCSGRVTRGASIRASLSRSSATTTTPTTT